MNIKIIGFVVMFLLIPWLMTTAEGGRGAHRVEKRVALVIGNGAYEGKNLGALTNPVNDANDIAEALLEFHFDVKSYRNLNKPAMKGAIAEFGRRAGNADAALFYFAGHGLQIKNRNYLMPTDATAESEALVEDDGVNVNYILGEMENAGSKINMVMLDACRNNAFSGQFRGGRVRGLATPESSPKGTVIVYATDPGNVAADGEGRNGLFTAGLLIGLHAKDLSLGGVLLTASAYVEDKSEGKQTPYVNGPETVKNKFKFRLEGVMEISPMSSNGAAGAASGKGGGQSDLEALFWQSIQGSKNPEDYKSYLQKFPKGVFASLAQNRLEALKGKPTVLAGGVPENDGESKRLEAERKAIAAERRKLEEEKRARDEADRKAQIEFVKVSGGTFQVGCGSWTSDCEDNEKPVHTVSLGEFELGRYEVTQGQWKKVMGTNPSHFSSCGDECPVDGISWNDVQNFLWKINQRKDGYTYRLPTEAEWEYACQSGGKKEKYCGGGNLDLLAWYGSYRWDSATAKWVNADGGNSGNTAHPVGQKGANGLGLYDMSGNVSEWVSDGYSSYAPAAVTDPQGPEVSPYRVLRGGSWYNGATYARSAYRYYSVPNRRYNNVGVRLLRIRP